MPKRRNEPEMNENASKKMAPMFLPKKGLADGAWKALKDELLVFTANGVIPSDKILGFDLDGTLIKTKSGARFPKHDDDWTLWDSRIPKKTLEFFDKGYKICIFTNQKGIQLGLNKPEAFKKKIQAVIGQIGIPIQAFVSLGPPTFRKPHIGMWKRLEENENEGILVDRANSLYIGDAAGRIVTKTRPKKDHAAADRLFALNLGVRFQTPEQFFLGKMEGEPYELSKSFDPKPILKNIDVPQFDPSDAQIPSREKEVIVFTGYPGSGKSVIAGQLKKNHGYAVVSRDELKTWQKAVEKAKEYLKAGKSVAVDCTNPDPESRQRYVKLAKDMNVKCRSFVMRTSYEHAIHNNAFRLLLGADKAHQGVNNIVMSTYRKNFVEPTTKEGFDQIVKVNFVPTFGDPTHRELYQLRLTDHK